MSDPNQPAFNFEYWARLAKEDPAAFEELRRRTLEALIKGAPEDIQRRLFGLQWQVDQIRDQASNPMSACLRLSSMMWDTLLGEDGLMDALHALADPDLDGDGKKPAKEAATVLPFPSPDGEEPDDDPG